MKDIIIQGLRIDWDQVPKKSYLRKIKSITSRSELAFDSNVTFFVGENGTGKSTLLEAIAVAWGFNAEGGTRNFLFSTYRDVSCLGNSLTLIKGFRRPKWGYFVRAETFFNVATQNEEYGNASNYHIGSHGENFLAFVRGRSKEYGLYIIDEPEAALSPQRQLVLLRHLYQCAKNGSQFIIATHSPILLGCPEATILSFDNERIEPCRYEDTESYIVTRSFLERKEYMLAELLKDERINGGEEHGNQGRKSFS
ncbi:MAG: AAA family ATPase [Clostridia bacterium]|nr:AAA family ATPase [Clostridia bacterium]